MRGLTQFIGDIRNCQNKEEERKRVDKEMANIRQIIPPPLAHPPRRSAAFAPLPASPPCQSFPSTFRDPRSHTNSSQTSNLFTLSPPFPTPPPLGFPPNRKNFKNVTGLTNYQKKKYVWKVGTPNPSQHKGYHCQCPLPQQSSSLLPTPPHPPSPPPSLHPSILLLFSSSSFPTPSLPSLFPPPPSPLPPLTNLW
jgi:hypothetical protein